MNSSNLRIDIERTVKDLKRDIDVLKSVLLSPSSKISLDCLDKILELQSKAIQLQKILTGTSQLEAQIICDATCTFCEKAIKEIGRTGCTQTKCRNSKNKKCKIHKLFDNFYSLFS